MSTGLTDLPLEIRQQIFGDYFKVPGGYVYDGKSDKLRNADNTPIDLSFIYTCRSIANDCKHLPLAVNTLHFSTLYREDWRSLAGCFNLAATYYNVLQQDLVLHLAPLITPNMHAELATEFPGFKAKLEAEREYHFHVWRTGDGPGLAGENMQPAPCEFVQEFYQQEVTIISEKSLFEYRGYGGVHRWIPWPSTDHDLDRPNHAYQRWDQRWDCAFSEIDRCMTRCLRLIAEQNPTEFSNRVLASLPHWVDKYPAEEFFNLRFDDWAIPPRPQVEYILNLLGIPEFVWKLPDMWQYGFEFHNAVGGNPSPGQFSEQYDHPTLDFTFRMREKTRFSAIAVAVRFLNLLPSHQRTQIRTLNLHEDLPSVNRPALHGHGLVPLLQENPLLQVQRHVSIVDCIMRPCNDVLDVDELFTTGGRNRCSIDDEEFTRELSTWLLDSLVVADSGISAEWFSLILDSGPYTDHCTEAFDKIVHEKIALHHAWNECLESGLLTDLSVEQVREISRRYHIEEGLEDAIMQLVHRTSSVLRCDFSPGLPRDPQRIVDGTKAHPHGAWDYWSYFYWQDPDEEPPCLPGHLKDREAVALLADIQSQEEYLQSPR
ncbi:uncharacterized protein B0J16DRAFT_89045 [Fusarium flagelliforme]|uniref:uncharacterized protein n=1 Tax=Fusarium flagelliforme TaxID=2675880 RepID=UPI001E8E5F17|nr:uncharacterized protein B0J16DRAFT_89045 [Fusarium flagelliforme]KAH7188204.1 hypothetical protein B0J16DRAFT_89045 [Fusarium flagelliforme]